MASFVDRIVGDLGKKARWRTSKARVRQLGDPVRFADGVLGPQVGAGWTDGERRRLLRSFAAAERSEQRA